MRIKSLLKKSLLLLVALIAFPNMANAQFPWLENFSQYVPGNLVGQGNWEPLGSGDKCPLIVINKKLSYEGYPVKISGQTVQMSGEKPKEGSAMVALNRFFAGEESILEGEIFASALINVESIGENAKKVWMGFTRKNYTPTNMGNIILDKSEKEGKYRIGVSRVKYSKWGSNDAKKIVYSKQELELGKTYLAVLRYQIVDGKDNIYLYINPTSYTKVPQQPTAAFENIEGSKSTSVDTEGEKGLMGFYIANTSNAQKKGVRAQIGCLSVARSYDQLFSFEEDDESPKISATPTTLTLNNIFTNIPTERQIIIRGRYLKSDITVTSDNKDVVITPSTISRQKAITKEGAPLKVKILTSKQTLEGNIHLSSEGAKDVVIPIKVNTIPVDKYDNCSTFNANTFNEESKIATIGTHLIVSFVDGKKIYAQDAEGGILLDNSYDAVTEDIKIGDKLKDVVGFPQTAWGTNSIILQQANKVSANNTVTPVKATLKSIKEQPKTYINRLVQIAEVKFKNIVLGMPFKAGKQYLFEDNEKNEGTLRLFKNVNLHGETVPSKKINLIGVSTSTAKPIIGPRSMKDLKSSGNASALTINMPKLNIADANLGEKITLGKIHISTTNTNEPVNIYITGKGAEMFHLSQNIVKPGTEETDVEISYEPTKVGKHSAILTVECTQFQEKTQTKKLLGRAIDPKNPPVIEVSSTEVLDFNTKINVPQVKTIKVFPKNCIEWVKAQVEKLNGFSVNSTIIMTGYESTLRITFNPKEAGTIENKITLTTFAAKPIVIQLKGKAIDDEKEEEKEGDELPLDDSKPLSLLQEGFEKGGERNKPISLEGWKNIVQEGTRAWWNYSFNDYDPSAGERCAKVTPWDTKMNIDEKEPCKMLLVTPALNFKDAKSKIFTFRVRGDYLRDEQNDLLQLVYIDKKNGAMEEFPVEMHLPNTKDESGEWYEMHLDLKGQNIYDTFFMGFKFTSTRGKNNTATYYIDDVSFGRTDLPYIMIDPEKRYLSAVTMPGKKNAIATIKVKGQRLNEPIQIKRGGANSSKFSATPKQLPVEGGEVRIEFKSDVEGVHEGHMRFVSRGAADQYVYFKTLNDKDQFLSVEVIPANRICDIAVYSVDGKLIKHKKHTTIDLMKKELSSGTYLFKLGNKTLKLCF